MRNEQTTPGSLARTHENQPGLPRGRSSLPAEAVESAQRNRLVRAMIAATVERGYAEVMIADVVQRARVSRKAFYAHFADKEACFLAATEAGVDLMFTRIEQATRDLPADAGPVHRLRAGIAAYLRFLTDEPEFAKIFLIDVLSAGPRALERYAAAHERFAAINRRWHADARRHQPGWPAVPDEVYVALVGAMHELVTARVRAGRFTELAALEELAVTMHLTLLTSWPV